MHFTYNSVILLIAIGLVLPTPLKAQEIKCNPQGYEKELTVCAADDFKIADQQMNELYQQKMKSLQTEMTKERLKNSQRTWLTYREKSCLYEVGTREEGGSLWPMQEFYCKTRLTTQRNEILKTYITCTENGCPY